MKAITQRLATIGQIKQLSRFANEAVEKAAREILLDKDTAQEVIEHGGQFSESVKQNLKSLLSKKTVDYQPSYVYHVKDLGYQINCLKFLYPILHDASIGMVGKLPETAEGWFAIPNLWKPKPKIVNDYNLHVKWMFDMLRLSRSGAFRSCVNDVPTTRLRQEKDKVDILREMSYVQGDPDILIIAAQMGKTFIGYPGKYRELMDDKNQFGLDVFTVGIILLTHPERFQSYDDLWIFCLGDSVDYSYCPIYEFGFGGVRFTARREDEDNCSLRSGVSSGFILY